MFKESASLIETPDKDIPVDSNGIIVSNINKSFRGKPVVRGVSFRLNQGEVLGLLGPNGAGKTTQFYMVVGLISTDSGNITLDGKDITNLPMYRRARLGIGYLPQEASVFKGMTVEQNISSIIELVVLDTDERSLRLEKLLTEFNIRHIRTAMATTLSGGERRRVEIARVLAREPRYVLLDEPFAGIDPLAVSEVRNLVSHLKDRGIGVLITDHNIRETLNIIDRALIVFEGKIIAEGTPDMILGNKVVREIYLGHDFIL